MRIKVIKIEYWDGSTFYLANPTYEELRANIEAVKEYFGPEKMRQFETEKKQCIFTGLTMDESEYKAIPTTSFGRKINKIEQRIAAQKEYKLL